MPKPKRSKTPKPSFKPSPRNPKLTTKPRPTASKPASQAAPLPPSIPFNPDDRILLVGEGDFSFAHSLLTHHACTSVLASSHDALPAVLSKYPQAAGHIAALEAAGQKVLHGVDATKLGKGNGEGGKEVRRREGWGRVIFNFPHVGGVTRDVNRQVRRNQELLVGFFTAALPLLAPDGSIVVTVFEGEPYELWNIRDLARHVGLRVGRSFKFQSKAYPGYKHARTLGNIEGGGGWKGEDRSARTYILERNNGAETQGSHKRKRATSEDDDEDD
ncbi:MAG: 25S rRNA (uridine-N(3))-methyltransferase [Lasallia pustulata]|uniref:25S rRNA (Uridine-N(3))-methyltransferase n=1 Tax=Lasallia pustulata TaxID=136370 RepID=A0A5M8PRX5_9LECA|nr:MAG: 25S rRNA (uridine-N(3))-methyltransferase [Lasallia pustulata]